MIEKLNSVCKKMKTSALLITNPVNIYYLTGVEADATYAVFDKKGLKIITNFIYFEDIKSKIKIKADVLMYGADNFYSFFDKKATYGFESSFMTFDTFRKFEAEGFKLKPCGQFMEVLRAVKTEEEINLIKKAVAITDKTYKKLLDYLKPGLSEIEVANFIFDTQRSFGASGNSFETIAARGDNSSLPHAKCDAKRKIKPDSMLKLDFGAVYKHYCSDMTRTVFFGKASKKYKDIYNIVLTAQLKAIEKIKPGIKAADIDKEARDYIASKGFGDKFGHGLGHGLGLEVHENPRVSSKSTDILEEGNVITVEPGIYLPGWGGIRIEDDVVVRKHGAEILTKSSKKLYEL